MSKKDTKSNISKYYLFQFFTSLEFFAPVIVLFWQARGLSLTQIMLLQSIYGTAVVLLEMPTGAIADYFGKRISLIFGSLLFGFGVFGYGFSYTFGQFVIWEFVFASGSALISGADSAFIRETLKSLKREAEYKKIEGKARGFKQIAQAAGNLFGGFIGTISLSFSLTATGFAYVTGFLTALFFQDTKEKLPRNEQTNYLAVITDSLMIVRRNRQILWLILFYAAVNSLLFIVNWFSQPYFQSLNIPVFYFGFIFAAFSLVSAAASALVDRFSNLVQEKAFLLIAFGGVLSIFILGARPSVYLIPFWEVLFILRVINLTLISDRILSLVPSSRSATILSFSNLLRRLVYVIVGPLLGFIGDN